MSRAFQTVVDGGDYFEGVRWHEGRWYASDAFRGIVCAFDPAGVREDLMQVDALCSGLGWLPDGSLLVVSMKDRTLLRRSPDGTVSTHADLAPVSEHWINDMVVDRQGRAWVGTIGFAIVDGADPEPGALYRVDPDGTVTVAVDGLWCPNGVVVTADGSTLVVAESFAARLTAFTIGADGALSERRVLAQFGTPPAPGALPRCSVPPSSPRTGSRSTPRTTSGRRTPWAGGACGSRPTVWWSTRSRTRGAPTSTAVRWVAPTGGPWRSRRPTGSSRRPRG
ncbi:sugar lactone lactonase YvrE [Pseudonocardia parietis]|uniref:Sugar lactone lactonase YvrE n=1 Tax=Pseudonocardia parietis TaxID=570936 RepID=A0ABS4W449_9PSEU|nr:SMP-30/gluconolactonase/LRE family protein [Pseudonocardia parietis]MBP2371002.1 sugar lactone lactonase YvrE [Pseudonocardia parietis]